MEEKSKVAAQEDGERTKEKGEWTCRLPSELMELVAKALEEDKAKGTFGSLQSTSSALYDIATPYMYRRIELINLEDPIRLLGVFGEVSLEDRMLFYKPVPVDSRHIVERNLVYRLRYYMSLIYYLHFTIRYVDPSTDMPHQSPLAPFHDIHDEMRKADQDSNLWSSLREMHLDYSLEDVEQSRPSRFNSRIFRLHKLLFTPDPRPRDLYVLRARIQLGPGYHGYYGEFLNLPHPSVKRIVVHNAYYSDFKTPPRCQDLEIRLWWRIRDAWKWHSVPDSVAKVVPSMCLVDQDPILRSIKIAGISSGHRLDGDQYLRKMEALAGTIVSHWRQHWKGQPLRFALLPDLSEEDHPDDWISCTDTPLRRRAILLNRLSKGVEGYVPMEVPDNPSEDEGEDQGQGAV